MDIILKNFRAIDIEDYTAHFLVACRYGEIHKVLKKHLDIGETDNLARDHIMKIKNITAYVNYIRVWRNSVKSSIIQSQADQNKKRILERFSSEIYIINENPYTLQTNLLLVLKYLNWKDELETERKFLDKRIHEFAANRVCLECNTRGMMYIKGVILCNECGFSMNI